MEELRRKPGEDGVREVEMNFKKRVARGLDPATCHRATEPVGHN